MAKDLPWGVLILFGGGLALAKGIASSGLAAWLGDQLKLIQGVSPLIIVIVITLFVLFLTEITSNTATATMILPILATLSVAVEATHCYGNCSNGENAMFHRTPPNDCLAIEDIIKECIRRF